MQKQPHGTGITGTAGLLSCCAAFFAEDGGVEGVVEGKAVRLRFQVGLQLRHLCVQGGNIHAVELSKALLCGLELCLCGGQLGLQGGLSLPCRQRLSFPMLEASKHNPQSMLRL